MAVIHQHTNVEGVAGDASDTTTHTPALTSGLTLATRRVLGALRIAFGLTFLWAFVDKLFALGFSTGYDATGTTLDRFGPAAWINGGSPTEGFLKFGADGPFKGFYNSIGGTVWADTLFMLGLLGIGVALTFGVGMRFAAIAGATMYLLMWSVALPPSTNPLIDVHILGAITVVALALLNAGNTWGLGHWWTRTRIVQEYPVLR